MHSRQRTISAGFSLIEMMAAVAVTAILVLGLANVVNNTLAVNEQVRQRNQLAREARFAMSRMVAAVHGTRLLLVPQREKTSTVHAESIRDPGVLAMTIDPTIDRDLDGFVDADNDKDGRIDEDLAGDATNDDAAGVYLIDDDNNGAIDDSWPEDDDEAFWTADEDPIDGLDNDGDGVVDEDPRGDMSADDAPGLAGVDDDGDGEIDEGHKNDDDEDGTNNDDWLDVVAFYLQGNQLFERRPNIDPDDGQDQTARVIADDVGDFRVELLPKDDNRQDLVDIQLRLGTPPISVTLQQRVRVGGAQ